MPFLFQLSFINIDTQNRDNRINKNIQTCLYLRHLKTKDSSYYSQSLHIHVVLDEF